MNKFFFKFKETYFWPKKKERFIKSDCHAQLRQGFWEIQKKKSHPVPRKLPGTCQEGRMDRPYFIGSFQLLPGVYREI